MRTERYWLECTRGNYEVLDRRQPSIAVARVDDPVDGERLVRLLNEDEERKSGGCLPDYVGPFGTLKDNRVTMK